MILLVLQVPRGRRAMLGCQDLLALKVQKALKEKEVTRLMENAVVLIKYHKIIKKPIFFKAKAGIEPWRG